MIGGRTANALQLYGEDEYSVPRPERKGRSEELIEQRNELFIARFAYYQQFTTHRYEEILHRLKKELHLAEFTLGKMVLAHGAEIKRLKEQKPSRNYFRKKWDWMVW